MISLQKNCWGLRLGIIFKAANPKMQNEKFDFLKLSKFDLGYQWKYTVIQNLYECPQIKEIIITNELPIWDPIWHNSKKVGSIIFRTARTRPAETSRVLCLASVRIGVSLCNACLFARSVNVSRLFFAVYSICFSGRFFVQEGQ